MTVAAGRVQSQTVKMWTEINPDKVRILEVSMSGGRGQSALMCVLTQLEEDDGTGAERDDDYKPIKKCLEMTVASTV